MNRRRATASAEVRREIGISLNRQLAVFPGIASAGFLDGRLNALRFWSRIGEPDEARPAWLLELRKDLPLATRAHLDLMNLSLESNADQAFGVLYVPHTLNIDNHSHAL